MNDLDLVQSITSRVSAALAGAPVHVQGAVIADVLAMYLAGHFVEDDAARTGALREQLLTELLATVRRLVPVNEEAILRRVRRGSH